MPPMLEQLDKLRRKVFRLLSGGKVISAVSHFVLVLAGCLAPAYLVYAVLDLTLALLTFHFLSELWLVFMVGREVVDRQKKLAMHADMDLAWQDGVGDLVGPALVYFGSWAGILWLVFAQ